MDALTIPQLVRRARDGIATEEDGRRAAELLRAGGDDGDRYDLLFVIGKANAMDHRSVVETYLEAPDDPMLSRLAIQILCNWWGPTEPYRDYLLRFIKGVDWDLADGSYVRQVASSTAGEYLRTHDDPELLRALIDLYADEESLWLDRGVAYAAILRALGHGYAEIPSVHREDWERHVNQAILAEARLRAAPPD